MSSSPASSKNFRIVSSDTDYPICEDIVVYDLANTYNAAREIRNQIQEAGIVDYKLTQTDKGLALYLKTEIDHDIFLLVDGHYDDQPISISFQSSENINLPGHNKKLHRRFNKAVKRSNLPEGAIQFEEDDEDLGVTVYADTKRNFLKMWKTLPQRKRNNMVVSI